MKKYLKLHNESWETLMKHLNKYIGYQLVTMLLITLLLMPLLRGGFNLLMKSRGYDYITNGLLQKFLISPQGVLMVLISLGVGFVVILLQLGGLVVLTHQILTSTKESRYADIALYTLKRLKYFLGFDGIILTMYFVLIAPLLDNELKTSLFSDLKIPGFIMQVVESNAFYSSMLVLVIVIITCFTVRWMFSLHVLLLDKQVDKRFLKRSAKVLKSHLKTVMGYFLGYGLVTLIVLALGILLLGLITIGLFSFTSFEVETSLAIVFSLGMIGLIFLSIISMPFSIIMMTKLYHDFSENNEPVDVKSIEGSTRLNKLLSNRIFIGLSSVAVLIVSYVFIEVTILSFQDVKYDVGITAHRGSSLEAPENTMSAIVRAYENGATHVEIDVQLTKDNQIILAHDETFKRTSKHDQRPDEMTLEEIQSLDVGAWFSEDYIGEKVPTLQDVMTYCHGKMIINIEIKGSKYSPGIYSILNDLIHQNDFVKSCVITSLNYDDLIYMENLTPELKTGYIMFVALGDLEKLDVDFYSIEAGNVSEDFVSDAHQIGREVHVWTVNDMLQMEEMIGFGVDNIITDNDKVLKNLINQNKSGD